MQKQKLKHAHSALVYIAHHFLKRVIKLGCIVIVRKSEAEFIVAFLGMEWNKLLTFC